MRGFQYLKSLFKNLTLMTYRQKQLFKSFDKFLTNFRRIVGNLAKIDTAVKLDEIWMEEGVNVKNLPN